MDGGCLLSLADQMLYFNAANQALSKYRVNATSILENKLMQEIEETLSPLRIFEEEKTLSGLYSFDVSSDRLCITSAKIMRLKNESETILFHSLILNKRQFASLNYDPFIFAEKTSPTEAYGIIRKYNLLSLFERAKAIRDKSSKDFQSLISDFSYALGSLFYYVENPKLISFVLSMLYSKKRMIIVSSDLTNNTVWLRALLYLLPKQLRRKIRFSLPSAKVLRSLKKYNLIIVSESVFDGENIRISDIPQDVVILRFPKLTGLSVPSIPYVDYVVSKLIEKPELAYGFVIDLEDHLEKYANNAFDNIIVERYLTIRKQLDEAKKFETVKKYRQAINMYVKAAEGQSVYSLEDAYNTMLEALETAKQSKERKFFYTLYSKIIEYMPPHIATDMNKLTEVFLEGLENIDSLVEKIHFIDFVLEIVQKRNLPVIPLMNELLKYIKKTKELDLIQKYYTLAFETYEKEIINGKAELNDEYTKHFSDYISLLFSLERYDVIHTTFKAKFDMLKQLSRKPAFSQLLEIYTHALKTIMKEYTKKGKSDESLLQNADLLLSSFLELALEFISIRDEELSNVGLEILSEWLPQIKYFSSRLELYKKFNSVIRAIPVATFVQYNNSMDTILFMVRDLHSNEEQDLIYSLIYYLTQMSFSNVSKLHQNLLFSMKLYFYNSNLNGLKEYLDFINSNIQKFSTAVSEYSQALLDFITESKFDDTTKQMIELAFLQLLQLHFNKLGISGIISAWKHLYVNNSKKVGLLKAMIAIFEKFISMPQIKNKLKPIHQFVLRGYLCSQYKLLKMSEEQTKCYETLYSLYTSLSLKPSPDTVPFFSFVTDFLLQSKKFNEFITLELSLAQYSISNNNLEDGMFHITNAIKVFVDIVGTDKTKFEINEKTARRITSLFVNVGLSPSTKEAITLWAKYLSTQSAESAVAWNNLNTLISIMLKSNACENAGELLVNLFEKSPQIESKGYFESILKTTETVAQECVRRNKEVGFKLFDLLVSLARDMPKVKNYFNSIIAPIERGIYTPMVYQIFLNRRDKFKPVFLSEPKLRQRFAKALGKAIRTADEQVKFVVNEIIESYDVATDEMT